MRYSDVVRDLVVQMEEMGFGGNLRIAQTLARAGVKLSRETVRRWRKQPRPPRSSIQTKRRLGPILAAKHPNHIWILDITEITGLFGLFRFKLALVMDVFSRMPLAGRVFTSEPAADEMAGLVRYAAARHSAPKHFVTDQGVQFTSAVFRATLMLPALARISIRTLRPSAQPKCFSSCKNAAMRSLVSDSSPAGPMMIPSRRMRSPCCARTVSGHATAEPAMALMKSRRLIAYPAAKDKQ